MYSSMNELPVGTPEQAGMMDTAKANLMQGMQSPAAQKVMGAMLTNSLNKMGQGLFGAPQLPSHQAHFDMYGNPLG